MKFFFKDDNGFTFLELMIAVTLSSMLLLMTYMAQNRIIKVITSMTGQAESNNKLTISTSTIQDDFCSMYKSLRVDLNPIVSDTTEGNNKKSESILSFYVIDVPQVFPAASGTLCDNASDIKFVNYAIKLINDKNCLVRQIKEITDSESVIKSEIVLFENIDKVKCQFYANKSWVDKWDSNEKRAYPSAIKMELAYKDEKNKNATYSFLGYPGMNGK